MKRITLLALSGFFGAIMTPAAEPVIRRIPSAESRGWAASVQVPDTALVFTGQVFSADPTGDATAQAGAALRALETLLTKHDSDLTRVCG